MDAETARWLAAALCGVVTGGIVLGAALWRRYRPPLPTPTLQPPTTWAELSRQFGIDPSVRPVDDGRSLTEKLRAVHAELDDVLSTAPRGRVMYATAEFWRDLLRTCPSCGAALVVCSGVRCGACDYIVCGACDYIVPLRRVDMGDDDDAA